MHTSRTHYVKHGKMVGIAVIAQVILCFVMVIGCSSELDVAGKPFSKPVSQTLKKIGLNNSALILPRLGDAVVSVPGRLLAVDRALGQPLSMIGLSEYFWIDGSARFQSDYLVNALNGLEINLLGHQQGNKGRQLTVDCVSDRHFKHPGQIEACEIPDDWMTDKPLHQVLRKLYGSAVTAGQYYRDSGVEGMPGDMTEMKKSLSLLVNNTDRTPSSRWPVGDEYHLAGEQVNLSSLVDGLLVILRSTEESIGKIEMANDIPKPMEWETSFGKVRVAGKGNDIHSGEYFILIDFGGDDHYRDVGRLPGSGSVSIVIDMSGDDTVEWSERPGPGSGILGFGIWTDVSGNDRYIGRNLGLGVGIFGGGMFWDMSGDDIYDGGSMVQGAGEYGIGILIDANGVDTYNAEFTGQGFGGPGGVGMLVDHRGDDSYVCGNSIPDQVSERASRHAGTRYLSRCQGYAFGIRPNISGGVGLLVDQGGDDQYKADLFAQGSSYWFGLGLLLDRQGNDRYEAFEHCQGHSLHLGAGFLGDWAGNDTYNGSEHCQGVGIDRAVGLLYDHDGEDKYYSRLESQGTGLKPYGIGLLLDRSGSDVYSAESSSQGYTERPPSRFPGKQWPVGVLLDLEGDNTFIQPGVPDVTKDGRIQNRQGIAIDG